MALHSVLKDHLEDRKSESNSEIDDDVALFLGFVLWRSCGASSDMIQTSIDAERSGRNADADADDEADSYVSYRLAETRLRWGEMD